MSIEEIKEKVIAEINALPEKELASVAAFINKMNKDTNQYGTDFIYKNAIE